MPIRDPGYGDDRFVTWVQSVKRRLSDAASIRIAVKDQIVGFVTTPESAAPR